MPAPRSDLGRLVAMIVLGPLVHALVWVLLLHVSLGELPGSLVQMLVFMLALWIGYGFGAIALLALARMPGIAGLAALPRRVVLLLLAAGLYLGAVAVVLDARLLATSAVIAPLAAALVVGLLVSANPRGGSLTPDP